MNDLNLLENSNKAKQGKTKKKVTMLIAVFLLLTFVFLSIKLIIFLLKPSSISPSSPVITNTFRNDELILTVVKEKESAETNGLSDRIGIEYKISSFRHIPKGTFGFWGATQFAKNSYRVTLFDPKTNLKIIDDVDHELERGYDPTYGPNLRGWSAFSTEEMRSILNFVHDRGYKFLPEIAGLSYKDYEIQKDKKKEYALFKDNKKLVALKEKHGEVEGYGRVVHTNVDDQDCFFIYLENGRIKTFSEEINGGKFNDIQGILNYNYPPYTNNPLNLKDPDIILDIFTHTDKYDWIYNALDPVYR